MMELQPLEQSARHRTRRDALYCRSTGRRLAPRQGGEPAAGTAIAVAVFDDGTTVPLMGDTVLGRSPTHDPRFADGEVAALTVSDLHISRCHLLLRVHGWNIDVIDLGSRNGTWIGAPDGNWQRILPGLAHRVPHGHVVRFGSRCLTLHYFAGEQAA